MRKHVVSPMRFVSRPFILKSLWAILLVFSTVALVHSSASAQPSRQEAVGNKVRLVIQIANEQYQRGLFKSAESSILNAQQQYEEYMTAQEHQQLNDLLVQVRVGLDERQDIARRLQESDEFLNDGQYRQAKELLESVKDNRFLKDQERRYILIGIKDLDRKLNRQFQQPQEEIVYDEPAPEMGLGAEISVRSAPRSDSLLESGPCTEVLVEPEPYTNAREDLSDVRSAEAITPAPVTQAPAETGYINFIEQKRARQRSYTEAVVTDAMTKAQDYLSRNEFEPAKEALARATATINKNQMLLGDELYKKYNSQLTALNEQVSEQQHQYQLQKDLQRQVEVEQAAEQIRTNMENDRTKAVEDYLARAHAFQEESRYKEAIGQLERLLAIEPTHAEAKILKHTLDDTVRWRQMLELEKESNAEEIKTFMKSIESSVPYSDEITYPGAGPVAEARNWKELVAGRQEDTVFGYNPADAAVYESLDLVVDLSAFSEETTFAEAIDIIRSASETPLTIIVLWSDLSENAFIEQDKTIGLSGRGLSAIRLGTGLDRMLQAVGGGFAELGYVVEDGVITVATSDSLPANLVNRVYDVSELLGAPAGMDSGMGGGMSGGSSGGMMGGMGGSSGGFGGSGGGGGFGGSSGGGGFGGSSGGGGFGGSSGGMMGGMGGGGMGGSSGGMGGGSNNMMISQARGWEVIDIIQETIEPDSWYDAGGDGQIYTFSGTKLIVWQTPEIHKKIKQFLDRMKLQFGEQVAIETRFLVVNDNFLEDIGLQFTINRLDLGDLMNGGTELLKGGTGSTGGNPVMNVFDTVIPTATSIPTSLGSFSSGTVGPGFELGLTYGGPLDDLQVSFLLRATQMHANSKVLTAPKVMVLSGETAMLSVQKQRAYVSNISISGDTINAPDGTVISNVSYFDQEIDTIPTGIMMNVTPTITSDKKYVILNITTMLNDEVASNLKNTFTGIIGTGQAQTVGWEEPVLQSTNVNTRVRVPDRGTVMLGGLTLTAEKEIEAGVPVLSKVPILGRLFTNRSEVKDKQVLLILVRPTVILTKETEAQAVAAMD